MVVIEYTLSFKKTFKKIKNQAIKQKIKTQIKKIIENPEIGKPMKYQRKETRETYVSPYKIAYAYKKEKILFLNIYHKDEQ